MQDGLVKELDKEHEFTQYSLDKTLLLKILSKNFTSNGTIPSLRQSAPEHYIAVVETSIIHDTP